jgi:hypothetical protein
MPVNASLDARDLRRAMSRIEPVYREELGFSIVEGSEEVVRLARMLAPRRLGNLRQFITYKYDKRTGRSKVGIKAGKIGRRGTIGRKTTNSAALHPSVYGRMVHEGTKYIPANPFMVQAAEMARQPVQAAYVAGLNRAAKRLGAEYRAAGGAR